LVDRATVAPLKKIVFALRGKNSTFFIIYYFLFIICPVSH